MKYWAKNPFRWWRVIASICLTAVPTIAFSQGRPNIVWFSGSHGDSVNSLAYSPDGRLLISGSSDQTIKLWRRDRTFIKSLTVPYDPNGQLNDVRSVAISPDGKLLAVGVQLYNGGSHNYTGAVQLWSIPDNVLIQTLTGYGSGDVTNTGVNSVVFSPNGQYLASGSSDRLVKVWRVADGTLVSNRSDHTQKVNAVAFSPDGAWLGSASDDMTAKLYRTSDWGVERTLTGHTNVVLSLTFSPNSARLATGSWDQTIRIWNVIDGSLLFSLPHGSNVDPVAFAPDGKTLASGARDGSIKLWDPERGVLIDTLLGHIALVNTLAFAPDGGTLASGTWYPEYAIKLWAVPSRRASPITGLISTLTNHSNSIKELVFTANGRLISGGDTTARFWNAQSGQFLNGINAAQSVVTMALSPDGQLLALPGANHTVKIYRASDGALLQTLVGHTEDITGLAFSHDGTLLASGAFFDNINNSIKLWNTSNWTLLRELSGPNLFGPFQGISFSANDTLLSATCEGVVAVWHVPDGAFIRTLLTGFLTRFSPDGTLLAITSSPYGATRVYRTSDWMQVATLSDQSQAIAFTPDGHYLAVGGQSQLQFWRVSDWTLQFFYDQELGYAGEGVSSVAFSPDGSRFAYGRMDAVVAVAANPFPPSARQQASTRHLRGEHDTRWTR